MLHRELTRVIVRSLYEVHAELGCGFLESVYEAAVQMALADRGIVAARQVPITARFRDAIVGDFRADLVVAGVVLVELKAGMALHPRHVAQVLNYLRASDLELGFAVNFGAELELKRIILTNDHKPRPMQPRSGPRSGPP